ncbi:MAG: dihydrofolate reductase [Spirochaetales bacterium]|nr:dihydrofolate reductase [Spirochaetales bacterium]
MEIILIWAMDREGGIGIENRLPWHYPADLKRFQRLTLGNPVLMGRKTFESLPSGPLPGRRNLVLSRSADLKSEEAEFFPSPEDVLLLGEKEDWPSLFIIGGAEIYKQFLPRANRLEITRIGKTYSCDRFFPSLDWSLWDKVKSEGEGELTFESYERIIRTR